MKFGLDEETYIKIVSVFSKYEIVNEVIIYGSRVLGTYKTGSDIDLTIKGEAVTLQDLNRILYDLDELMLPYGFDVSIYSRLNNEDLKAHINRVGATFYSRTLKSSII